MRKLKTIEMTRLSIEAFKAAQKLPLVVVLDNVRSLYNVGSVFRSGDAFRIEALYLCGITATPPHTEIHKTALGGEDSVASGRQLQAAKVGFTRRNTGQRLCRGVGKRGERRATKCGRPMRWLLGNPAVGHQTQPQREHYGRHCDVGICPPTAALSIKR